ncbi:hypothetical protein DYB37_005472, partial [Aphanomyces astaci]
TDEAAARIKELMASRPDAIGIRLGVRTRTCALNEHVVGVKVFIESKALFHVVGTTMDYKITPVSAEFTFENPNAKGTCGCGESFNV